MASIPHLSGITKPGTQYGMRFGTTPPSNSLGFDGEIYVDKTAFLFYGPKADGLWGPGFGPDTFGPLNPVLTINGNAPDANGDIVIDGTIPTSFIREFVGNGALNSFDIGIAIAASTIALVSLNGIIQRPTVDYTIVGTTLSFSDVPGVSDAIAVRILGYDPSSEVELAWGNISGKPTTFPPSAHVHTDATTSVSGFMSAGDKTKLNGVATAATANAADSYLLNRANHTGTQAISTVAGLQTAIDGIALKANIASPALTGIPTAPTATAGTNTIQLATTAFVGAAVAAFVPDLSPYATKASPTFTGTVTIPTATLGDNTTKAASTAYVMAGLALKANSASPAFTGAATFVTRPTFNGATPWDSANFTPGNYVLNTDTVAASKVTGVLDVSNIPILPSQVQVVSSGDLSDLTAPQQTQIGQGTVVTTTDGKRYVYTGSGSKTNPASYIELADITPEWTVIANKPTTFPPSAHSHVIADVTGLQGAIDLKAPLASPALTGTPTAPTAAPNTNTVQVATTAFVGAAVAAFVPDLSPYATKESPALTGVPTAPTAIVGTGTNQIATMAAIRDAMGNSQPVNQIWTSDGVTDQYAITPIPDGSGALVTIDGMVQIPNLDFTVIDNTLTLVEVPVLGSTITYGVFGSFLNEGGVGLDSPAFVGFPTAPTAPPGSDTNQIATMAAVQAAIGKSKPVSQVWTADGVGSTYTLPPAIDASRMMVTIDGLVQLPDIDYTIIDGIMTLLEVPYSGSRVTVGQFGTFNNYGKTWADIEGRPAVFPPSPHTHPATDITGLADIYPWVIKTGNYSVATHERILADTSGAPWTLTLPPFGEVFVQDYAGTWATKNLTVIGPIRGVAGNLTCDQPAALLFVRPEGTTNWTVTKSEGINA